MDRDSRRLSHNKGSKITTQSNVPLSSDGEDGDQIMAGSTLYTKSQGRWMPFKSGGGNINDGWHGSQKYVKILPNDFVIDDDDIADDTGAASTGTAHTHKRSENWPTYEAPQSNSLVHNDATTTAKTLIPSEWVGSGGSNGAIHPGAVTGSKRGMGAFVPIPLGYWAIACKIYSSYTWRYGWNSNIPQYCENFYNPADPANPLTGNYGSTAVDSSAGIQAHNCSLVTGGSETLLASLGSTNVREIFDTAMLGQEANYCYVAVNGLPTNTVVFGGYIELRRVKTAEAIAEEESDTGGDSLPRGG